METPRPRSSRPASWALATAIAAGIGGSGLPALADPPFGTPATAWLTAAYERKASGDLGGAVQAFEAARRAGADSQRISLELAYAHLALGETSAARDAFAAAAHGADADLASRADQELDALPSPWWADLYGESFGWHRIDGSNRTTDLVPTLRLRGYRRLAFAPDVSVYLFAQGTRDTASRGLGSGAPTIYADDHALFGAGVLVRTWQRRLGWFAQLGPAVGLVDDGTQRVDFDARGGTFLSLQTAPCGVPRHPSPRCEELYAELTYTSRFDHDALAFARARQSLRYLETGPLSWQMFWELRGAADRNGDYYDNFVDVGAGPRWRLTGPAPLDLLAGAHLGRYLGRENVDPGPARLQYVDLRILATTYVEF